MTGCENGHVYEKSMGDCPGCTKQGTGQQGGQVWAAPGGGAAVQAEPAPQAAPPRANRVKIGYAWLVEESKNRRYDLFQGITRIGRDTENDIVLIDKAVSRKGHAQISENSGHFRLSDIGGKSSVLLNGKRLGQPSILQNSDRITVGDTVLVFVTSR
jgi:pSer/pThr/pTyr-binding forkhead associated (FHA) protein